MREGKKGLVQSYTQGWNVRTSVGMQLYRIRGLGVGWSFRRMSEMSCSPSSVEATPLA